MNGYNNTILAYGQTGAGKVREFYHKKTFTLFGKEFDNLDDQFNVNM